MTKIFHEFKDVGSSLKGAALAIGYFDGMHLGHQAIVERTFQLAKSLHGPSAILTFSPHPTRVLKREVSVPMICTERQRVALLKATGIDALLIQPFSSEFALVSAQDFITKVLVAELQVGGVVVGQNFTFGHKAQGTAMMLRQELHEKGIAVEVVAPVMLGDEICSSTQIRHLVQAGEVRKAANMLGRWFTLDARVVPGAGRGRTIGVPTINLKPANDLLPAVGVYATLVHLRGASEQQMGATNVGYRPTFDGERELSIETHILDFSEDLYGKEVEICFVDKLRDEKKFNSIGELVDAIQNDISKARATLSTEILT